MAVSFCCDTARALVFRRHIVTLRGPVVCAGFRDDSRRPSMPAPLRRRALRPPTPRPPLGGSAPLAYRSVTAPLFACLRPQQSAYTHARVSYAAGGRSGCVWAFAAAPAAATRRGLRSWPMRPSCPRRSAVAPLLRRLPIGPPLPRRAVARRFAVGYPVSTRNVVAFGNHINTTSSAPTAYTARISPA